MRNLSKDPLVSVCLITYNQERFIADAIESALMQQADFGFEIVIGDDCSTDGTREICEEYQRNYPDVIRLLPKIANLGLKKNFVTTLAECRGEYIAYLEGDDKWTSPHKLALQLDVMARDKEVVLVHTDWLGYDVDSDRYVEHPKFLGECIREVSHGMTSVVGEIQCTVRQFRGSTIFFRKKDVLHCIENDSFAYITSDFPAFDFPLCVDLSVMGKFHYIDEVMLTANLHDSLSASKELWREFDFTSKAFFMVAYYIDKYSVPSDIKRQWARRQLHLFTNFPFKRQSLEVVPAVLRLIDSILSIGGVPTFRQRVLIYLMKSKFFMVSCLLYGKLRG